MQVSAGQYLPSRPIASVNLICNPPHILELNTKFMMSDPVSYTYKPTIGKRGVRQSVHSRLRPSVCFMTYAPSLTACQAGLLKISFHHLESNTKSTPITCLAPKSIPSYVGSALDGMAVNSDERGSIRQVLEVGEGHVLQAHKSSTRFNASTTINVRRQPGISACQG